MSQPRQQSELQKSFYTIIFGTETRAGQLFDLLLILVIVASVTVILLDSMPELDHFTHLFWRMEIGFTLLFTVEYLVRIWCAPNRRAYLTSVYGVIDLLAILPTYLALVIPGTMPLLVVRLLRLLRIFRVLRLLEFLEEANELAGALRRSARKIFVFFSMILLLMVVFGALIYVIEGPEHGFTSIPLSIYWAVVTITTVGYGDITPMTWAGRAIASIGMLTGYAIIAVPTGIVSAELAITARDRRLRQVRNCTQCARADHEPDADYCKHCGAELPPLPGEKHGNEV